MSAGRHAIARHVRKAVVEQLKPCFLLLDREFRLVHAEGESEHYGYGAMAPGEDCREVMPFLYGLAAGEAIHLPLMETASGRAADVLLSPLGDLQGLLLTDVGRERAARQVVQQQANEIRLLHREQRRLIAELRKARDELEQRYREAEESNRHKSRFIAGLSHELRTPLTGILGHVGLLREAPRDPAALSESLTLVEANANHLLSLVDNVLDQASMEVGQLVLHPVPTRLTELWHEMRVMFGPLAARKGLGLGVHFRRPQPEWVELDATRLRQVVINLVGNGIKFTDRGRVVLSVAWAGNRLQVSVSDTGPGIAPAARERIFLPFQRAEHAALTQGTGLGLAISHQLVGLMGGELRFAERPGGGSIFTFSLPAPEIAASTSSGASEHGAGQAILLVDDSEDICRLYERVLAKAGFDVDTATDEPEAWRRFERKRPDLVIADLYLKEWDGSGLIRRLRGRGYLGGILAWSASSLREDRQRAIGAGADSYLVKPVEAAVLCASVCDALRRRE